MSVFLKAPPEGEAAYQERPRPSHTLPLCLMTTVASHDLPLMYAEFTSALHVVYLVHAWSLSGVNLGFIWNEVLLGLSVSSLSLPGINLRSTRSSPKFAES